MKHTWLFFVAGAVLTWGAYVVTIDHGRKEIASNGMPPANAGMWAFLFIGLAYCVLAVIVPGIFLMTHKADPTKVGPFNMHGAVLSTVAGLLGAAGALCIVFAVGNARRMSPQAALFVAPLVFSFAPIVNCLISLIWDKPEKVPSPMFFVGLLLAAGGAALVLIYKPAEAKHAPAGTPARQAAVMK
jgi:drug/metabolite transporter (DMT)-like permease